jgi:hypothetical protein
MQRLRFEAFLENLTNGEKEDRIMELVSDMSGAFPDKTFHSLVECPGVRRNRQRVRKVHH